MKSKILLVLMIFTVIFYSCTKKSACADANGYYDTGYFTYFDEKITIDPDGFYAHDVNAVSVESKLPKAGSPENPYYLYLRCIEKID